MSDRETTLVELADLDRRALATFAQDLLAELRAEREVLRQYVDLFREQLQVSRQQTELLQRSPSMAMPRRFYGLQMLFPLVLIVLMAAFLALILVQTFGSGRLR